MASDSWKDNRAQALKILGDGAEVPDLPAPVTKAKEGFDKAYEAFDASREDCEAKLLDLTNANSAWINSIEQFRAKIEKNNFQLDPKKDGKKIQQAQKMLTGAIDEGIKRLRSNEKSLDELDKHIIQINKYKQSGGPM